MKHKNTKLNSVLAAATVMLLAMPFENASADGCFSVGEAYASERNASLIAAEASVQNGVQGCEIVILKAASNGNRPKREVVFIPR